MVATYLQDGFIERVWVDLILVQYGWIFLAVVQ